MVGIAYIDDKQVRPVKATVIPNDQNIAFWSSSAKNIMRLTNGAPNLFLVKIYERRWTWGP